jgi:hypothetical protein
VEVLHIAALFIERRLEWFKAVRKRVARTESDARHCLVRLAPATVGEKFSLVSLLHAPRILNLDLVIVHMTKNCPNPRLLADKYKL